MPPDAGRGPNALVELTRARLLEVIREPGTVFWIFGFPVMMAIGLGLAFRDAGPEPVRVGYVSGDAGGAALRGLVGGDPTLLLIEVRAGDAESAMARGAVDVVAAWDGRDTLDVRFDPSRPEPRLARLVLDDAVQVARGVHKPVTVTEHTEAVPGTRYIDFLLPGLLGLNLMGSSMWGIGYAIVNSRRRRLMRAFAVTPMRRWQFLLSYGLARAVWLALEVGLLGLLGWLVFDVTVQGSLAAAAFVALVGASCFAGIALAMASRTRSVEVANGLMNLVMLPMWIFGGVFFSYERFPDWLVPLVRLLPLAALNDALRAVVNEGAGLTTLGFELGVLAFWGATGFVVARRLFRWH